MSEVDEKVRPHLALSLMNVSSAQTHHLTVCKNRYIQVAAMSLNDAKEAPPADGAAEGEQKLSKKQLKKLAKGKLKKDKPKPTWGEPGGKKKKEENKAISLPKKEYVNNTPKGEKKILGEMEEAYHPVAVESAWQDWWEARYVNLLRYHFGCR